MKDANIKKLDSYDTRILTMFTMLQNISRKSVSNESYKLLLYMIQKIIAMPRKLL